MIALGSSFDTELSAESWGAVGPGVVASRGVVQGSGDVGGVNRRGPTGAAAYGMPRNDMIPASSERPTTGPAVVLTDGRSFLMPP